MLLSFVALDCEVDGCVCSWYHHWIMRIVAMLYMTQLLACDMDGHVARL
jgi:hypothetical protein